jgi:hypothetical protein
MQSLMMYTVSTLGEGTRSNPTLLVAAAALAGCRFATHCRAAGPDLPMEANTPQRGTRYSAQDRCQPFTGSIKRLSFWLNAAAAPVLPKGTGHRMPASKLDHMILLVRHSPRALPNPMLRARGQTHLLGRHTMAQSRRSARGLTRMRKRTAADSRSPGVSPVVGKIMRKGRSCGHPNEGSRAGTRNVLRSILALLAARSLQIETCYRRDGQTNLDLALRPARWA